MTGAALFDRVCEALEGASEMSRLEARGTMRIALRKAGLSPDAVDGAQMKVVLGRVLPDELRTRGVPESEGVSRHLAESVVGEDADAGAGADRFAKAEAALERLGG